jgi:mannose-1-phosphate guanylyltransferase/phosphomannomutase
MTVYAEDPPLGNIGCAGRVAESERSVLAVYADNLTTLPLQAIVAHHVGERAALTLAVHEEPFQVPYGRVGVRNGRVTSYQEKPTFRVPVCSAVTVLGPAALDALPADRPTGLADLTVRLLDRGQPVAAFHHDCAWVDVNDARAVTQAEKLMHSHSAHFSRLRG